MGIKEIKSEATIKHDKKMMAESFSNVGANLAQKISSRKEFSIRGQIISIHSNSSDKLELKA